MNPIGYFMATLLEGVMFFYICFLTICMTFLGLSFHLLVVSMAKDLEGDLGCLNSNSHRKRTRSRTFKQITEFSQLHASVKELSTRIDCDCYQSLFQNK